MEAIVSREAEPAVVEGSDEPCRGFGSSFKCRRRAALSGWFGQMTTAPRVRERCLMQVHESRRSAPADTKPGTVGFSRMALSVVAAWMLSLGFDVFLHGGLLARLYVEPSPFLLGAEEAFRRIPLGYLAFLVLTLALYWLLHRLGIRGAIAGLRYGAVAGAVVWGAFAVGLYSISTATVPLLAGWWVGQTVELGLAGAVLGAAANGVPLRRIWAVVIGAMVACAAGTIVLQSLGLAPPMKLSM